MRDPDGWKMSSLLGYVKKERDLFARYNRTHPHFKRNIFIDALISTSIVIAGFAVVNQVSEASRVDTLLRSGGVAMTSTELIKHVIDEKIAAYWLGPIPGYKYTIIRTDRREIIISYIPQGVSLNLPDRFNLTIETYSKKLGSESPGMLNISSDRDDFVTSSGTSATIYSDQPQRVQYAIPGADKYAEVQYPSAQRIYDMYKDGERLRLISES